MNYHRANSAEEGDAKARSVIPAVQSAPVARDPYGSSVGAYMGPATDSTPDFQINLLDYLHILIKRRWLILSVVAASLVLTVRGPAGADAMVAGLFDPGPVAAAGRGFGPRSTQR